MGKKRVMSAGARRRKAKRQAKRAARRAARRARLLASYRRTVHELFGAKIVKTTREYGQPLRVVPNRQPVVMHRVDAAAEPTDVECYVALFAAYGGHAEVPFQLDPDSTLEIKRAAYEAAVTEYGDLSRAWHLIKVEGTNELGRRMLQ